MDKREIVSKIEKSLEETKTAYQKVFTSDAGKIVLDNLEKFCGYNSPSVNEQSPNELQTFYNEGKRRVILRIHSFLEKGK